MEHQGICNFLSICGVAKLYEYEQQTCVGYKIVTAYHAHQGADDSCLSRSSCRVQYWKHKTGKVHLVHESGYCFVYTDRAIYLYGVV